MFTGFYKVDIDNNKLKKGFVSFRYRYKEDGQTRSISNISLKELERDILSRGLTWKVVDKERAYQTRLFDDNLSSLKNQYQKNQLIIDKKLEDNELHIQNLINNKNKLLKEKKNIKNIFLKEKKENIALYKEQTEDVDLQQHNIYSQNISKALTSTGFYLVSTAQCTKCKSPVMYRYQYQDKDGKRKKISSIDLDKLEQRVKAHGLVWKIVDKQKAKKTKEEWIKRKNNIVESI